MLLEDRVQKDAVEKVAHIFYVNGKKLMSPMFVISEFKFSNFLHNVALDKENKKDVNVFQGDHDVLVISFKMGIVFIQVKSISTGHTLASWNQVKDGFKQILKDKIAMRAMNRDLPFINEIPIAGFVAVPNVTDEQLTEMNFCEDHRKLLLTKSDLCEETFELWLASTFSSCKHGNENVFSFDDYTKLCSRYVGLASVVKLRTLSDAISKLGGRVSRGILNPDQNFCLKHGAQKNILLGDFGTGKSLLLMKKAEEIAKNGGRVYVISFSVVSDGSGKVHDECDNLVPFLRRMLTCEEYIKKNIVVNSFLDVLYDVGKNKCLNFPEIPLKFPFQLTPDVLCDLMKDIAKDGEIHFFFDELPLSIGLCEGGWTEFESFCEEHESMFVWISFATCSFSLKIGEDFCSLEDYGVLPGESFERTHLKRCMRTTRNGFKLIQAVRKFKGDGLGNITIHGNVVDGPRPLWLEMSSCSCGDQFKLYECRCVGTRRMKSALSTNLRKIKDVNLNDITILLHDTSSKMTHFLADAVQDACKALSIHYKCKVSSLSDARRREAEELTNEDSSDKGALTLVDIWSYKGNECKVVIFVDPYNGPVVWKVNSIWHGWVDISVAACRSLAQLIFITWPSEEQYLFLQDFKERMDKAVVLAEDEMTGQFCSGALKAIIDGRRGHPWEHKNFMDFLVAENVIDKMTVNE